MRVKTGEHVRLTLDFERGLVSFELNRLVRGKNKQTIAEIPGLFASATVVACFGGRDQQLSIASCTERKSLFGSMRADAVIDILVEPLEGGQVRFAFQMSDTLPPFIPAWAINYVVQNAMVQIFDKMAEVASSMANKDPASLHLRHVQRPAYAATKAWIEERFGTSGGAGAVGAGGES